MAALSIQMPALFLILVVPLFLIFSYLIPSSLALAAAAPEDLTQAPSASEPKQSKAAAVMYDTNVAPKHCLQRRAIQSDYIPTGYQWLFTTSQGENITIYETRLTDQSSNNTKFRRVLFAVYDIFGFHPNTKQVVDKLAEKGQFRIVMPDFLHGGWKMSDWPLNDNYTKSRFNEFMRRFGSWEHVRRDLVDLIKYYETINGGVSKQFGIFGFCWGGRISVEAASELSKNISAAAMIHPANVMTQDAEGVETPMYVLPSKNEPDMIPFYKILAQKFGPENVGHHRFDDMFHGFAGARGDFNNPLNRKRVDEVIDILQEFFNHQLRIGTSAANIGMISLTMVLICAFICPFYLNLIFNS